MHIKRWITSIVALPVLIALIVKGGRVSFAVLIAVVALVALWEYLRMVMAADGETFRRAAAWPGMFVSLLIVWAVYGRAWGLLVAVLALQLIFWGALCVLNFGTDQRIFAGVTRQITGIVYIPLLLSFLVALRNLPDGVSWIFLLIAVVFAGDTAAFYTGSFLGRHKLCPAVSPNKTIEGAIGGLAGSVAVGALIKSFFLPQLPWLPGLLLFVCIALAGQLGDLFESVIKRSVGIKDSGAILPGHGGILDRIDALIFAAPTAYFFKELLL